LLSGLFFIGYFLFQVPVPLEYSIEWLTCAVASRFDVVMIG
jgi:hypothetical protein